MDRTIRVGEIYPLWWLAFILAAAVLVLAAAVLVKAIKARSSRRVTYVTPSPMEQIKQIFDEADTAMGRGPVNHGPDW